VHELTKRRGEFFPRCLTKNSFSPLTQGRPPLGGSRMGASTSASLLPPVDVVEEKLEYDLATYSYYQSRSLQGEDPEEAAACVDDFVDDILSERRDSWTSSSAGPGQRSRRDSRDDYSTSYEEGMLSEENVHREALVKNLIVKTMVKNNNSSLQQLGGENIYRKIVEGVVAEGGTGGGGNGDYHSSSSTTDDYLTNNSRRGGEGGGGEGGGVGGGGGGGGRSSGRIQITPSIRRRNGTDLMLRKENGKRDDPPNVMFHQRQLQQRRQHQQPQRTSNNRNIDPVTNSFDEWSILSRRAQHYKQLLLDSNKASTLLSSQPSTPLSASESEIRDDDYVQMRYRHAPSPIPSPTHHYTNSSAPTDPPSFYDSIVELQKNHHHGRSTSAVSTSSLRPHSRKNGEIGASISNILSEQSRDRRKRYKEMLLKQSSNKDQQSTLIV